MQQHVWLLQSGLKACSGSLPAEALDLGIEDRALTLFMSAVFPISEILFLYVSCQILFFFIPIFPVAY